MIRITESRGDTGAIIQIAGRLEEQHLVELERIVGNSVNSTTIDLSDLQSADSASVQWLKAASHDGAEIIGATPYIALLIDRAKNAARERLEGNG